MWSTARAEQEQSRRQVHQQRRPTARPRVGADRSASSRSATVSGAVNAAMSGMAASSATRSSAAWTLARSDEPGPAAASSAHRSTAQRSAVTPRRTMGTSPDCAHNAGEQQVALVTMLNVGDLVADHGSQLVLGQGGDEARDMTTCPGRPAVLNATSSSLGRTTSRWPPSVLCQPISCSTLAVRCRRRTPSAARPARSAMTAAARRGDADRRPARGDVLAHVGDVLQADGPEHGWSGLDGQACFDDDGPGREQPSADSGPLGGRERRPSGRAQAGRPSRPNPLSRSSSVMGTGSG